jgi:NAD(P)H-dependent FMN reductase
MKKISMIIGSTRQGRVGKPVSDWLLSTAKEAGFELKLLDLQTIALPFFDAMVPPAYMPTQTTEGKAWAEMIANSDGFIFVTPEYNRSIPASLKNAIDFLVNEWKEKPAGIVSYGYIDGGASATKHLNDIFDWLKIKNVSEKMAVPFNQETFDDKGQFKDIDAALGGIKEDFIASLEAIEKA